MRRGREERRRAAAVPDPAFEGEHPRSNLQSRLCDRRPGSPKVARPANHARGSMSQHGNTVSPRVFSFGGNGRLQGCNRLDQTATTPSQ